MQRALKGLAARAVCNAPNGDKDSTMQLTIVACITTLHATRLYCVVLSIQAAAAKPPYICGWGMVQPGNVACS